MALGPIRLDHDGAARRIIPFRGTEGGFPAQAMHDLVPRPMLEQGEPEITEALLADAIAGRGVAAGRIEAFFQPQIDLSSGRIVGVEALARWRLASGRVLAPGVFLAAATRWGLVGALDEAVTVSALEAVDLAGGALPRISVNASARSLRDSGFLDRLRFQAEFYGIEPARIAVEVVESTLIERDDDIAIRNIRALKRAGFRVELDDFGSGHAALSNLVRLEIDAIKIDRSLVGRLGTDARAEKIVRAVARMGSELGLDTIGEGVESAAQIAMLRALGCRAAQGYAIGRPMSREGLERWIEGRGGGGRATALSLGLIA